VSLELDEHRLYLSDRIRVDAFRRALAEVVTPADVVLDLGTGTGVLGMLACRAGAARVYAVDSGPMAGLAREIVRANGLDGRMTVLRSHSTQTDLPERVSLILTDQIGNFGFNAGLFEYLSDARARLLAPGGRTIPAWVELCVAPAAYPPLREQIEFWDQHPAGLNYAPAADVARSTGYPLPIAGSDLLSTGVVAIRVEPPDAVSTLSATTTATVERDGTVDGLAGWFRAGLSPSVTMTNAPGDAQRINRRPVMLPFATPRAVSTGDRLAIKLRIIAPLSIIEWTVSNTGESQWVERGSTFKGLLMSREDIDRTRPGWTPAITEQGRARQTVLELCDGTRALADIERMLFERHPGVVATPEAAAIFVAEVVTRYGK
jgi:protein arginine N-methyltransferase 1